MAQKGNPGARTGAAGAELPCTAVAAGNSDHITIRHRIKARAAICWRWIVAFAAKGAV